MDSKLKDILAPFTDLSGLISEELPGELPFSQIAARFSRLPGTIALFTGGERFNSGFNIIGVMPRLIISGKDDVINFQDENKTNSISENPFDILDQLSRVKISPVVDIPDGIPIAAGLMGFLSYDLNKTIEDLPRISFNDLHLPDLYMTLPSLIVIQDKNTLSSRLFIPKWKEDSDPKTKEIRDRFFHYLSSDQFTKTEFCAGPVKANMTKDYYLQSVNKIIDYIKNGDIYQANFAQRFSADFSGDAFALFQALLQANPAEYFAFVNAGDFQILSTSPERFLKVNETQVETRPIKGTRPRGLSKKADMELARELSESEKDAAELAMIVDLLRNDLGKVCKPGTIMVKEHKKIESFENVHHLVSVIGGELENDKSVIDLIRATFPGGSITGCPKIRSMEVIDELEPHRRHVYTGSIGYISFHNTMDLSIAIRTATVVNGKVLFSVGGGIVYDSVPEGEYEESLSKGKTFLDILNKKNGQRETGQMTWVNGQLKNIEDASIPISDLGLLYGFGIFETIRLWQGEAQYLEFHLERLQKSWEELFAVPFPDLDWKTIIARTIVANGMGEELGVLKIIATAGSRKQTPFDGILAITAKPYEQRFSGRTPYGIHMLTYPGKRETSLADHKTLNYLYYHKAGEWALESGGDEALILNVNGSVSETNTGNLFLVLEREIVFPKSDHVLPGVMERVVKEYLEKENYRVISKKITVENLLNAEAVYMTNSLVGVVPVLSIDGKALSQKPDLWRNLADFTQNNGNARRRP